MMNNVRVTLGLASIVLALAPAAVAQEFGLFNNEHLNVESFYRYGDLWNFSTADVLEGGYIESVRLNDDALLRVLEYRYGTDGSNVLFSRVYDNSRFQVLNGEVNYLFSYNTSQVDVSGGEVFQLNVNNAGNATLSGGQIGLFNGLNSSHMDVSGGAITYYLHAYNSSTVSVSGGSISRLRAWDLSIVDIVAGSISELYAYNAGAMVITGGDIYGLVANDNSVVDISGGDIDLLWARDSSTVVLTGFDFQLGPGLWLDGDRVYGTGVLSGKWLDRTDWAIDIRMIQDAAEIKIVIVQPYSDGNGSEADPFQISSVRDWYELTASPVDWDQHFVLTRDLDFRGAYIEPVGIGAFDENRFFLGTPFLGVFDGNNHTVRNFVIHQPDSDLVGLFGWASGSSEIRDLAVESFTITGGDAVGGLVGGVGDWDVSSGTISRCYAAGNVSGQVAVGGLVGYNGSHGTINESGTAGHVLGIEYGIGGLCGLNDGSIEACYAVAQVDGQDATGGLVGENYYGSIARSYAAGEVAGYLEVGGLVGYHYNGTISDSYATGVVVGYSSVGGLLGFNEQGAVIHCYSTGKPVSSDAVGGLCGAAVDGGLYADTGNLWDTDRSGLLASSMGKGMSSEQIRQAVLYAYLGWDVPHIWRLSAAGPPRLAWEDVLPECGDADHPYPVGDLNRDCQVDLADLAILAAQWLACTAPQCDP